MNKQGGIVEKFMLISLMLSPLFIINWLHDTRMPTRGEYLLLFQSLTMLYVALSHKDKYLKAFFVWSVLSFYIFKFQGSFYLAMIFFGSSLFYIAREKINNNDLALKYMGGAVLIVMVTMLSQVIGVLPLTIGNFTIGGPIGGGPLSLVYSGVSGLIAQPNITGAFLAICLPVFFIYHRWALGLVIVFLVMTKCNGAIIAGSAGVMFYCCFQPKAKIRDIVIIVLVCVVLSVGFCFIDKPDYSSRWYVAKLILIKTTGWNILVGNGLGSFAASGFGPYEGAVVTPTNSAWMKQAHNEYLQVYYELGLIGLGLILFWLGSLIGLFIKTFKKRTEFSVMLFSCLVVLLTISAFSFNFHHPITGMFGIVLLVMVSKNLKKEELV